METFCYPSNVNHISLTEFQLANVTELLAESKTSHSQLKIIYVAAILSVVFHVLLITFMLKDLDSPGKNSPLNEKSPILKVKLTNNTTTKNAIADQKTVSKEILTVKDSTARNSPNISEPSALDLKQASVTNIKPKNTNTPNSPPTIETRSNITNAELDPLIYDENVEIVEPTPNAFNQNTVVFNSVLRKKIEDIQRKKFEREKITSFRQLQKDNEYYEFKPVGGSTTVRINGNCFVVPENQPLATFQNIWSLLGNCKKEGPALNFEDPVLEYRYHEKND